MRPDGSNQISGFMTQLTLTGGFANKTLFEQAGVAIPGKDATWDDWVEAASAVAKSQQVPFAMAIDRSGHRITGPNISYGGNYIGSDGKPAPIDQGTKDFIARFVGWTADGTMSKDVWVSAAGSTYRAAAEDFINGQLAFYYSGSWQMPNFSTKIGSNFDWVATGSPCGPAACSGMPGGAALVAMKYTKNPKDVAKVMEYLAREDVVKEFSERTLFLPAHKGVIAKGNLDFKSKDPQVKAALNTFVAATATTSAVAQKLPGWRWSDTIYGALVTRVGQVVAGELPLDEAFSRIDEDYRRPRSRIPASDRVSADVMETSMSGSGIAASGHLAQKLDHSIVRIQEASGDLSCPCQARQLRGRSRSRSGSFRAGRDRRAIALAAEDDGAWAAWRPSSWRRTC